jgi:hypothetical protein
VPALSGHGAWTVPAIRQDDRFAQAGSGRDEHPVPGGGPPGVQADQRFRAHGIEAQARGLQIIQKTVQAKEDER